MTSTNPFYRYVLPAVFIVLLIGWPFLKGCDKATPNQGTPSEQERISTINTDSIRSIIESQYREKLQAQIKADSARYIAWQANYKPKAQKAKEAVARYQKQPTLENCDSAVTKLVVQVSELETGLAISDSVMRNQGKVITSQAGTIVRKDSVIDTLNVGWQKANDALAVEKGKDLGLGLQLGGTLFNGKPTPYIGAGLNYNVVRFRLPKFRKSKE